MQAHGPTRSSSWMAPAAGIAAAWLATSAGLLWISMDRYDEPSLALGGRIVRAGGLPYVDFYTHYGPFGYSLMALFLGIGNPGIACRLAQAAGLAAVAVPMVLLIRRLALSRAAAAALAALLLLNFSTALAFPHFLAYTFALLTTELIAIADLDRSAKFAHPLWLAAGAAAGLAGLVRPAFGAYTAAAVAAYALASRGFDGRGPRLVRFLAGAAGATAAAWAILYREISLEDAWFAMIVIPEKLTAGAARYLPPSMWPDRFGGAARSLLDALYLAGLFLLATAAGLRVSDRRARAATLLGVAVAAGIPSVLHVAAQPGRAARMAALLLFAVAAAVFAFAARDLAGSASARVSALSGLAAVAFLHYSLTRGDQAHVTTSLAFASVAGIASLGRPTVEWRSGAIAGLLALVWLPVFLVSPPFPAYWIGHRPPLPQISTARGFWARFPASAYPVPAVMAVAEADRRATPTSRFVALSTDHARTDTSAISLFLLSTRLPYTRWYQYDPGVQSSPFVQGRMIEELERSGSESAVTWRSELYRGLPPADPPRTPLDRRFRELYPSVAAGYGDLEVRERAALPAAEGGATPAGTNP